jgi:DNA repair/transcription protein MET18/MMS19
VVDLLLTISSFAPWHIQERTLPLLFSSLPDQGPAQTQTAERAKCWRILSALGKLCIQPELFETLVTRLLAKLDLVFRPSSLPSKSSNPESNAVYAHSILETLLKTLTIKAGRQDVDVSKYVNHLVPALYSLFICSSLSSHGSCVIGMDPRLVNIAAQIITLIVRTLPLS